MPASPRHVWRLGGLPFLVAARRRPVCSHTLLPPALDGPQLALDETPEPSRPLALLGHGIVDPLYHLRAAGKREKNGVHQLLHLGMLDKVRAIGQ